jgi:mannitol-specific phosphotransferase system IIBC component
MLWWNILKIRPLCETPRERRFGPPLAALSDGSYLIRRSRPNMKKLLTLLFALVVAFALTMPVFAQEAPASQETKTETKAEKKKKAPKPKKEKKKKEEKKETPPTQ